MEIRFLLCALTTLISLVCAQMFPEQSIEDYFQDEVKKIIQNAAAEQPSGFSEGFCPKVCIDQGCLIGSSKVGNKQPYEAFYGIPYAAPPIGKLRFKNPEAPAKFKGLWDSTYHREACLQNSIRSGNIIGSEDCLYLNVYKPTGVKLSKRSELPVLVFFHGGSYKYGSSDPNYYGPEYVMDSQKVVLVTLQFRHGVFGFLSSGDPNCEGNFGLKDQNMALKWIQRNIKEFGGDPDNVSLMGYDSGSAAVHLHTMSSKSDDLFHKAIFAGSLALAHWTFDKSGVKKFNAFAKLAGLNKSDRSDSEKIMKKLMKMSANDLQALSHKMFSFHKVSTVFRPVIEGNWETAFITANPHKIWKSGDYQQRPYLIIGHPNEGGDFDDISNNPELRQKFLEDFDNNLAIIGDLYPGVLAPIKKYFFKNNPKKYFHNMGHFLKYWSSWYAGHYTNYLYTKYGDTYKNPTDNLLFNFTTNFSITDQLHDYVNREKGPSHYDSELYLFRSRLYDEFFPRGAPEESATVMFVDAITSYVENGYSRSKDYPYCNSQCTTVFCRYLEISRNGDKAVYGTNTDFDAGAVRALDQVMEAMGMDKFAV